MSKSGLNTKNMTSGYDPETYEPILTSGNTKLTAVGMESPDWNLDGKLGNDPRSSGVDMNRTL